MEAKERQRLGKQQIADPTEKGQARDKAAELLGINRQYITDAKKIEHDAPEILEQVKIGKTVEAYQGVEDRGEYAAVLIQGDVLGGVTSPILPQ